MKPVIAFANHKGGVGKTTSAVNIASVLGETGKRVLVIDIDPQGSASLHFGFRDKGAGSLHAGVIACRANPRRIVHMKTMADLERRFPGRVAPFVRENVALAEAPAQGKPVTLYAPGSNGAEDYRRVTQWLLKRLG